MRLREAEILFREREYSGAYYLAGYAVECALKACICRKTRRGDFPPNRKALENIYTHSLEDLVKGAELQNDLRERRADQLFNVYWALVTLWKEDARYDFHTRLEARDLLRAISDPQHGIMQWLAAHW